MRACVGSAAFSMCLLLACETVPPQEGQEPQVEGLVVALESATDSDVTAVRFDVVAEADGCGAPPLASETIALLSGEADPIPNHAYASTLLLLAPGTYRVCASPLAGAAPSAECAPTQALTSVVAEQTTELMLVSQCQGAPSGGVGTVVSLNRPPRLQKVTLGPSKYITTCETLKINALATDPEGDDLTYSYRLLAGSADAHLRSTGAAATFSGPAGSYLLEVSVLDAHEAGTQLTFSVSVTTGVCSVPQAVHDIILAKCTPCHTTNPVPSAGMSLATPRIAYASLVSHGVASSACSSRTRVIPGEASTSYLIAKLRGEAGICGVRMPRGRDPLPEAEIAIIEAWINDLPH